VFKPNPTVQEQSLRSQQTIETTSSNPSGPSGVPGALSNQPPGAASAPLTAPAAQGAPATAAAASTSSHRETTVNYEVDKTIRHIRNEVGAVKRLSVAVVVNQRRSVDKEGKVTQSALTEAEMTQISDLVREAMGFTKERGDTINVVNAVFNTPEAGGAAPAEAPFWRDWLTSANIIEVAKYLLVGIVVLYLWFGFLRPTLRDLMRSGRREPSIGGMGEAPGVIPPGVAAERAAVAPGAGLESDLQAARDLARQDPRIVANVVKDWVGRE
jgi:flagellar M-ring protein FliF